MNIWGVAAQDHWRRHRPRSLEALEDPERFFTELGQDAAARYLVIRDGLLEGVNPNDGSMGWAEFQERTAQADQTAREIVETEMIYLPPGEMDQTAGDE
ncbi:MAG: hypothetical protein ACRD2C_20595 [Acidimicrobiales bacterium]